ncbi:MULTISPECIES: protein regulator of cytokinesis family protein [Citrobacter]|jgi:hypothetical protein|uniref:protein regulator of cytokinesis family protein n=2 Tax=Enterobacteriaceae TaxID=543 RepID=UPI001F458887|nr:MULTISPECIES: protein regulator of cytokinesis family protein [Citrobacter]
MKPDVKKIIADIKATKGNRKFCNGLAGTLQDDNYASSICKYVKTVTPERIDLLIEYTENLEAEVTDMAVQLANAESKCRELAAGHWPRLQEQDINALMRFNETCEDGEGYDIGAEAMARLVEIGLAGKGPHGIRNITPFGQWVINAREGEVDLEPLKTEEDNIAESALRMAQLRTGAAQ